MNYKMDDTAKTVEILPNQKEVAVLYKKEQPSQLFLEANEGASSKFQLSVVTFQPNESLEIEQNGYYYEQNDIIITGYWAWEKVADMLPYNFMNEPVKNDEVVITPITASPQPTVAADPLTGVSWKAEESRIIEGNNVTYYKRGGKENSINLDNDVYTFNADNAGVWSFNGQDYRFSWEYTNAEKTKIKMIIQYPTPLLVNLENVAIASGRLSYTRLQQLNGVNLMAIETRMVK